MENTSPWQRSVSERRQRLALNLTAVFGELREPCCSPSPTLFLLPLCGLLLPEGRRSALVEHPSAPGWDTQPQTPPGVGLNRSNLFCMQNQICAQDLIEGDVNGFLLGGESHSIVHVALCYIGGDHPLVNKLQFFSLQNYVKTAFEDSLCNPSSWSYLIRRCENWVVRGALLSPGWT